MELPVVELDALFHMPGWVERDHDEFREPGRNHTAQNLDERSEENREKALTSNGGKGSLERRSDTRETRESDRHLGVRQQNRMDAHF